MCKRLLLAGFGLAGCLLAPPAMAEPAPPGPFLEADSVSWKVNAFAIARWKTLVGGNEGGQIDQADVQFGIWELAPHAVYHGHRHEAPEIYYVISGAGEWTVGETTTTVGPGSTIYTAPGDVHKMVNLSDEPLRTVWFWWAPDGRRDVFDGAYEFTEPAPQQSDRVVPWDRQDAVEKLH